MKEAISIITANYCPFRLVLRDGSDSWQPSLEDINSLSYDYVKLHRVSTYMDVGILPFGLGICFDGTLLLPIIKQFRDWNKALTIFNKTLGELLLGGLFCEAVSPDNIGYGTLSYSAYSRIYTFGRGSSLSFHQAARTTHISAIDVIRLWKPETMSVSELHKYLKHGRNLITMLGDEIPKEQILYGATFYVRKQWTESLIHIWTVIERIIEICWQRYIININNQPSKKRRDFLNDHRTWTVSPKLEVLFQRNLLQKDFYEQIDVVRKARNEFIHRCIPVSAVIAEKAINVLFKLASLCASEFKETQLFGNAYEIITTRSESDMYPKSGKIEPTHFHSLPPIPGDVNWGDKEYEVIDELCLKPLDLRDNSAQLPI